MFQSLASVLEASLGGRAPAGLAVLGRRDAEPAAAWTPATDDEPSFLAYSVTKTALATIALQLRDEGRLDLDAPVSRWVPRPGLDRRVTPRRLLRHSAGVPDYGTLPAYHAAVRDPEGLPWDADRFLAETLDRGLLFEPDRGWAYSNPGFLLIKLAVQRAADRSLRELVSERLAGPLGLERTFVAESREDLAGLAKGRSRHLGSSSGPAADLREAYHPGWVSHGLLVSTPSELTRLLDALFAGRLLSEASSSEMRRVLPLPVEQAAAAGPDWRRPGYGLGLMIDPESRWGPIYGHEGGGPGHQACVFHAPELGGLTACAMGGLEDGWSPRELVFALFDRAAATECAGERALAPRRDGT